VRFGIFELDSAAGELRRNGSPVRLAPQPFQVLRLLVEREGQLVDRDRIRQEVWGDTAVDFDRSLNVCIAQIRAALNDDAESPRFIQTVPRRGYRFLAQVERQVQVPPAPPKTRNRILIAALGIAAIAAAAYRLTPTPERVVRIAVLPFEAVGLGTEETAQMDGLFDELLTRLSGVAPEQIRVIGRRSVMRVSGEHRSLKDIGARLDVKYATEGTARQEAGRLRLAVRFAQTAGETVMWSETFAQDGSARDFEEAVVARVSAAVLMRLFPNAVPAAPEAVCREGWEAYRAGRVLAGAGSIGGLERSIPFFTEAPCAASKAALSESMVRLARLDSRFRQYWNPARRAAREAVALDGGMSAAHLALGNVRFWHDWKWNEAEQEFQFALRRNPSNPDVHHDLAWLEVSQGRRAEALASLARALALDPLSARTNMDAAWLLLQAGRFRESAAQARRTLQVDPEMREAYGCLFRALLYAGDFPAARAALEPVLSAEQRTSLGGLAPEAAVHRMMQQTLGSISDPYQRALRLAWLGSRDQALTELETAFKERSNMMPLMAVDPGFAGLKGEARFQKLVRDLGLR
jgi:DNA-binding winged helix-turn-helix (wHTH) protein/TolB-like protein/Tfp pilus assembly protein PilF